MERDRACMDGHLAIVLASSKDSRRPKAQTHNRGGRRSGQPQRPLVTGQSVRDLVLFLSGLALLYHQSVVAAEAQEVLVGAALALIFGPIPLRLDERRRNGANGS